MSDDSPLTAGSITSEEASWIGSLLCLGAIFSTIVYGYLADLIGRKKSALLLAIPQTVSNTIDTKINLYSESIAKTGTSHNNFI